MRRRGAPRQARLGPSAARAAAASRLGTTARGRVAGTWAAASWPAARAIGFWIGNGRRGDLDRGRPASSRLQGFLSGAGSAGEWVLPGSVFSALVVQVIGWGGIVDCGSVGVWFCRTLPRTECDDMKRQAEGRVEALEPRLEPRVFSARNPPSSVQHPYGILHPISLPVGRSVGRGDVLLRAEGRILANCRRFQIQQLGCSRVVCAGCSVP